MAVRAPHSGHDFAALLKPLTLAAAGAAAPSLVPTAPLLHLDYPRELQVKDQGLSLFWQQHRLSGRPEAVLASPLPRGYRTTSKRRALLQGNRLFLLFGDKAEQPGKRPFVPSPLEPSAHEAIYRFLRDKLCQPAYTLAAAHLNYLIIRGSYAEWSVIFNVDKLNGPLVHKFKLLAEHLQQLPAKVTSAFLYLDPSGSDYYLESRRPEDPLHFKKLYGSGQLTVTYGPCRYYFHPTSFSQINEAMVPVMLDKAAEILGSAGSERLLDLYCGYGLFSHFLAPRYHQVLGIDGEGPSIRAAAANGRQPGGGRANAKFLARRITAELFADLPPASAAVAETVLLDPPRQGPLPGVIAAICRRRPRQVLHIFCGVDQIPPSLQQWHAHGYKVRRIVPLDMFPGTANLEIMISLTPGP